VLVTAAAGGMGVLLVQLARAAGWRVIGAARGAQKLDAARNAGAEAPVDYSEPAWTERVRELTAGHGADVVFDGAGGRLGSAAFEVTADGGLDAAQASRRGITVHGIGQHAPAEFRRLARAALAEAAAGRIKPVIGQTFPLARAATRTPPWRPAPPSPRPCCSRESPRWLSWWLSAFCGSGSSGRARRAPRRTASCPAAR